MASYYDKGDSDGVKLKHYTKEEFLEAHTTKERGYTTETSTYKEPRITTRPDRDGQFHEYNENTGFVLKRDAITPGAVGFSEREQVDIEAQFNTALSDEETQERREDQAQFEIDMKDPEFKKGVEADIVNKARAEQQARKEEVYGAEVEQESLERSQELEEEELAFAK